MNDRSLGSGYIFGGGKVSSKRVIYTPSAFARANLLYIQETGSLTALKPHVSRRENLDSYLFFLVTDGKGTLTADGTVYELHRGDCGFIDCRRPYSHQTSDELWSLKWVHFYGSNMSGIYDKYIQRGGKVCFKTKYFDEYADTLSNIYNTASSESHIRDMQIAQQLMSLLTLLMDESRDPQERRKSTSKKMNMEEIKKYIDNNFSQKISLDDLAGRFYINKFYLSRAFKSQYGVSVNSYIVQLRITAAKRLLRFSDKSIEQIGLECGINDANYFTRMFKKVEGITPGEYRKSW